MRFMLSVHRGCQAGIAGHGEKRGRVDPSILPLCRCQPSVQRTITAATPWLVERRSLRKVELVARGARCCGSKFARVAQKLAVGNSSTDGGLSHVHGSLFVSNSRPSFRCPRFEFESCGSHSTVSWHAE